MVTVLICLSVVASLPKPFASLCSKRNALLSGKGGKMGHRLPPCHGGMSKKLILARTSSKFARLEMYKAIILEMTFSVGKEESCLQAVELL